MPQNLTDLIHLITKLLLTAVPVIAALALLFFMWGMAQFILSAGDMEKRKTAQSRIIWGLVSLFVILSVAAFVAILQDTFFGTHNNNNTPGGATPSTYVPGTVDLSGTGHNNNTTPPGPTS
jgi:hypothetical protein